METRTSGAAAGQWRSKPVHALIERLLDDHKVFKENDLPRIESLLEQLKSELGLAPAAAVTALSDFRNFKREFTWHMDEEESFLYPKVLRTDACLHDPGLYPEVFKGSITAYTPSHIHYPEEAFLNMLDSLSQKVRALPIDPGATSPMKDILSVLNGFASRLTAHAGLESGVLFPWTAESESVLRDRAAKRML